MEQSLNLEALSLPEKIAHSTVRIEIETSEGQRGTGTGFYFSFADEGRAHIPVIITNKHVVEGAVRGHFYISVANSDGTPAYKDHQVISQDNFQSLWVPHPDSDVDLCAMPVAPFLRQVVATGRLPFFVQLDMPIVASLNDLEDLSAMEDILMIGYPNGIWDKTNNMPVFRKGVTATHPNLDWNGKAEFLIDAACFPGSSGSPVFLFSTGAYSPKKGGGLMLGQRVKLLGILYAGPQHTVEGEIRITQIPTAERQIAVSTIPNNLGIVIKARQLDAFEKYFRERFSSAKGIT